MQAQSQRIYPTPPPQREATLFAAHANKLIGRTPRGKPSRRTPDSGAIELALRGQPSQRTPDSGAIELALDHPRRSALRARCMNLAPRPAQLTTWAFVILVNGTLGLTAFPHHCLDGPPRREFWRSNCLAFAFRRRSSSRRASENSRAVLTQKTKDKTITTNHSLVLILSFWLKALPFCSKTVRGDATVKIKKKGNASVIFSLGPFFFSAKLNWRS